MNPSFFIFSSIFSFFHFSHFSTFFISFHFLSFSFMLFHFVGGSKSDVFQVSISLRFLLTLLTQNSIFGPISGPSFPFFPTFFFSSFLSFLLALHFSQFFVHFFIFFILMFFFFFFLFFLKKKVSSFRFSCISFKYVLLLALVSEFNCFLRSRCSMEIWCPGDIGRDSWDWVGPPAWGRACFNSPDLGGSSSPEKTEPP